ncbi:MAG: hypothetical protein LBQ24_01350 [Candidatus Peribacteria bacterium]|nr:hypothetical protein [Candidatus Peribacteria bacterium]
MDFQLIINILKSLLFFNYLSMKKLFAILVLFACSPLVMADVLPLPKEYVPVFACTDEYAPVCARTTNS